MRRKFNDAEQAEIIAEAMIRTQEEIAEERGCSQSTISRTITEGKLKQGNRMELTEMATTNAQMAEANAQMAMAITQMARENVALAAMNTQLVTANTQLIVANAQLVTANAQLVQQHTQQNMLPA